MPSAPYQALLVVGFGGPEGPDDVMPFLQNVLRGRNVPRERMLEVAEHYNHFGGVSPLNGQVRELISAMKKDFLANQVDLPIYWGNRNWHPMLADTVGQMKEDGIKRGLMFVTSGFSSYSGCRQYRENVAEACQSVGKGAPELEKIRVFFNHPGYIEPVIENVQAAIDRLPIEHRESAPILFTAHSIPQSMATGALYETQLEEASRLVSEGVGDHPWKLVYQSRSGPPSQPWLEPDVCDAIRDLHQQGDKHLVVVPIGFLSDHMEVLFDLDTEAKELCDSLGITMERAATVGTHPRFVSMIRELVLERLNGSSERLAIGALGPSHDFCPEDCCPAGRPSRPTPPSRA